MIPLQQLMVRFVLCFLVALTLSNCVGVYHYDKGPAAYNGTDGVYHPVKKGQTLYSIAKAYGMEVDDLQRINGIWDPADMEEGQYLWIPDADRVRYVAATVPGAPKIAKERSPKKRAGPKKTARSKPKAVSAKKKLMWPIRGGVLTSRFGTRNGKNHHGIDIGARRGTPILASSGGTVKFSGWGPTGYGLMIIVKHPGNLTTVYAHNSRNLVKEGSKVKRGQAIGHVGKTGRASGPHLHFEVRNDTHPKNPMLYLKK